MSGVLYFWLPFIGLRRWTVDGHGMICAFAIFLYWCCGSSVTFFCTLLPQYYAGNLSFWIVAVYAWLDIGTLISFLNAATSDPGVFAFPRTDFDSASQNYFALPNQKPAQPSNDFLMDVDGMSDLSANQDGIGMSFCEKCTHWRPKNAHHCRRCGVCVRRMDHHCPWINNCVGALNMYLFLNLLTYALLASVFTFCSNLSQLIYFNDPVFEFYVNDPFVVYRTELRIFGCIISGAMITFMFSLLGSMHTNILFNSTTLEEMRKDFKKVTGGPGKPGNAHGHAHGHAHDHSHSHSHGHSHDHTHGKAQGEGDGPESCYEHGQTQQNSQNPTNSTFNAINEQMTFPLPRRTRDTCCNAYRKLCGRRPMIAWLIPLELNCPPPTQKTVDNVNFSLQDVSKVSP